MENQLETQDVKDQDELENELHDSAGYFVRTDLRAGSGCPVSRGGPNCLGYLSPCGNELER